MNPKIKIQINNRLRALGFRPLEQTHNRGKRVWYVPCARLCPAHRYTLADGIACWDWWSNLHEAHRVLFADAGISAEHYND